MDDAELYQNAGRKASSLLDTFGVPAAAFKTGLTFDQGGKRDPKQPQDVSERHLLLYNAIIDFIPGFDSELDNITSKELNVVIAMVAKGMSEGRSADLNSVKHKGLQYIPLNMYSKEHALDPPIPEVEDKSIAMAAMQAGEITMTAHNWPMFFYEDSIYDAADKTKGLFRNHTAIRFYKHLFIGPSSVANDSSNVCNSAKPSKNRAWGLTAVNRYIIAYVHVIHWMRYIGDMDLEELLWAIIEMLDDDSDPWVEDTLMWWNSHLKPTKDNLHSTKLTRKKEHDDDRDMLHAPKRLRRSGDDLPSPRHAKSNAQRHASVYDNDEEVAGLQQPTHPRLHGRQHPLPLKSQLWHHVVISDDDENDDGDEVEVVAQPKQPRSDPHMPLPPRFNKSQYSTSDHGTTIQMLLFDPKGFLDQAQGSEKRKYHENLLNTQTHSRTGEKPPRPKPKPKLKPRRPAARDKHEDSLIIECDLGMQLVVLPRSSPEPRFEPDFWSGSLWFGPWFPHQPEPDQKVVLGSGPSLVVRFWFDFPEPSRTVP
ncbi:uncharacterized protein F5147DRAFT_759581 [Suillus discolor]|uniref:Uncharacterized protein n=1 Tax=Suillus discolor TaxID=1912936 RepID=A0A9P7JWA9_9AGAM|nr:uncharacterized protein F5147DRAFT_759581 [Suillus discolor]KAG2112204.1 hypothetical protein F5147DRAFT_759581 [Suillus discolor]